MISNTLIPTTLNIIEVVLTITMCIFVARLAVSDERSGWLWAGITLLLCALSLFLPLAGLRILLAPIGAIVLMTVVNFIFPR